LWIEILNIFEISHMHSNKAIFWSMCNSRFRTMPMTIRQFLNNVASFWLKYQYTMQQKFELAIHEFSLNFVISGFV
jgi:hypothetical protein